MFSCNNIETSTGYIIHKEEFTPRTLQLLYSKLSVLNFKTQDEIPSAIFETEEFIGIPKIDRKILENVLQKTLMFNDISNENKQFAVEWDFNKKYSPFPHQVDTLTKAYEVLSKPVGDRRVCLCLAPGLGKTFCSAYLTAKLEQKFMFVVYGAEIRNQSHKAFVDFFGEDSGLYTIDSSHELFEEGNDFTKINGIFITHSMIKSIIKNYSLEEFMDVIQNKIGIGLKIFDEFDRETKNTYQLDTFMNIRHSIYLTGTKYRSLRPDDVIFQSVFRKVPTFGHDIKIAANKTMCKVNFKSSPSASELFKLQRDENMFKIFYNNFLAKKDVLLDGIMEKFYHKENSLFKNIVNKEEGQVIFFVGRIDNCDVVKHKLIKNHNIDERDIGIINSTVNNTNTEKNKYKPYLISTCQSLGRGFDSPVARALVFMEFSFSKSEVHQAISRVGRVGKKEGYVIYPIDNSFNKVKMSLNKHEDTFRDGFKKTFVFDIPENNTMYISGYRHDSEEGIELIKKRDLKRKQLKVHKVLD